MLRLLGGSLVTGRAAFILSPWKARFTDSLLTSLEEPRSAHSFPGDEYEEEERGRGEVEEGMATSKTVPFGGLRSACPVRWDSVKLEWVRQWLAAVESLVEGASFDRSWGSETSRSQTHITDAVKVCLHSCAPFRRALWSLCEDLVLGI